MALTDDLTLGLFEVLGVAVILRYGLLIAFDETLPSFVRNHTWLVSLLTAYSIVVFDWLVVYRRFRSPLRRLPVVKRENVMAERPRGRTPLQWFRRHPDADMINMRGFITEVLYPASPEALRDILNTHSYDWEKPWGIRAFLARIIGFGLIASEGDPHRRQRKFLTPAFHVRNIRDLYGTMWDKTNIFIDQLGMESAEKGHVEISEWASRLTLDIIGPAALSRDFASLTTTDTHPVVEAFLAVLEPSPELVTFMVLNTLLPQFITTRLPVKANKLIWVYCSRLRELCQNILDEKHGALKKLKNIEEGKENDILQHIIETGEFTDEELVAQMLTFLAAGHETTASALTWASFLLASHPELQKRLREEVRTNIPAPNSAIDAATMEAMPLLNGVCEEVLRLYPTVPLTIREAQRETIVAGTKVPKGTMALIVPYAINRHPRNWGPDAEEFQPERWIDTLPDGTQRPNKHGGAPNNFCEATFLHGPRSCIGQNFAKAELRCAVAGFVGRFNIELAEPEREVIIGGTVTTKPVGGLKLKLTPVEGW